MEQLTVTYAQTLFRLAGEAPPDVAREAARRSLLNVLGTAIGASREAAVDKVVAFALRHGGSPLVPVLGRPERLDVLGAAVANGVAAHLDDFDDTHLSTVIHPGAATLAAGLSAGVLRDVDGERFLRAFALGCEAQLRVGVAMSPEHYDDGWHITGTCAPLGAAVTAGVLLGLDAQRLTHALGLAASQTLGQREGFGSMVKPFHAGKGASNGLLAALLAERGFTAPTDALEDPRGYFAVLSPNGSRPESILDGLGSRWELESNAFKPYPCGVVTHPVIDAAVELSSSIDGPDQVTEIIATVHPLVPELTGNMAPETGLQARFSTAHGLAVALLDGRAGLEQYRDARVNSEDVRDLRAKVRYEVDSTAARDEATVEVRLIDGSARREHVTHARGSAQRPLTEADLRDKVHGLVDPVLPGRAEALFAAVDELEHAPSLHALAAACTPEEGRS
ncbi:MAG: MmgE/PrpD family protein [Nitriliruptorales bacterium]|nr:MmgE/PrpD family protein [Nitriliruptorales bacterium]